MSSTFPSDGDQRNGASAGRAGLAVGTTAGVATLFLLLRLLAVADWNWSTAAEISETLDFSDTVPIVLGTLFAEPTLTAVLLAVLLPLAVIELVWPAGGRSRVLSLSGLLFAAALLAASATWMLSFRSPWFVVGAVAVAVAVIVLRKLWREGVGHDVTGRLLRHLGLAAVGGLLVLAVVVDTPWMAHEKITVGDQSHTGYVLAAEAGFIRVLTDDRGVVILNSSEVTAREVLD